MQTSEAITANDGTTSQVIITWVETEGTKSNG